MKLPAVVSLSPPLSPPSPEHLPALKLTPETKTHDEQQHSVTTAATPPTTPPDSGGGGTNPSLLITGAVILFVFVTSASIHLLLRFLSRHSSTSSPSGPLVLLRRRSSSSSAAAPSPPSPSSPSANRSLSSDMDSLIDSLPVFTASPSLVDGDCAVYLSRFHHDELLCLLPSCCHAFHASCIDTWLRSTPSCPLCRSPILIDTLLPPPPPPPPPEVSPPPATAPPTTTAAPVPPDPPGGSRSYRVEIGSVSRRSDAPVAQLPPPPPPHARSYSLGSYSLGSSFEYVVEGEMEAVASALPVHAQRQSQAERKKNESSAGPPPPGEDVAEAAGDGGGSGRNWLRDYVDRMASSASSSFSSLRFSRWGSRRTDSGGEWDLEWNGGEAEEGEESVAAYYALFHRWLTGA